MTATVSGSRGDGMMLNMHIKDAVGNEYGKPRDVAGENRYAFTAHADSAFDVCFENVLTSGMSLVLSYSVPSTFPSLAQRQRPQN